MSSSSDRANTAVSEEAEGGEGQTFEIDAVITCYNYAEHVAGAIESALAQVIPYGRIIVVDDGSTDASLEVIRSYGERVKVVQKPNSGHLGACVAGLALVEAPYVHFLDADDRALPEFTRSVVSVLGPTVVKVQCQLQVVDAAGKPSGSVYPTFPPGYDAKKMADDNANLGFYQCTPTSGNVFSTEMLRSLGLERLDPRGALDGAACLAAVYRGDVVSINRPLVQYGVHGESLSNSHTTPTPAQFDKEIAEFHRNWRDACVILGWSEPPFKNIDPLYIRERKVLSAALRNERLLPALPGYISTLRKSNLTPRHKLLQSLWIGSLILPNSTWRRQCIAWRRSGADRPQWLQAMVNSLRRGQQSPKISVPPRRENTPRVAILSAVNPYPSDSGKAIVLAGFLEYFRDRFGAENVYYLHIGKPIANLDSFSGVRVIEMGSPTRQEQLRALLLDAAVRGRSLQETFTASRSVGVMVSQTLAEIQPDLEVIDTVRMSQFVNGAPYGRRVVYFDDLFSVRYTRMLDVIDSQASNADFDPLGQFGQFIPGPLHRLTASTMSRKLLLRTESKRVERTEKRVAQDHYNAACLLLNDAEAALLEQRSGRTVDIVPVAIRRAPHDRVFTWNGRPEFIFMGLLSIAHNQDGLADFLRYGMPRLLELQPDAVLHVVGRDASSDLLALGHSFGDHVVFHGYVPDLEEVLGTMCALVNPLRFGSGVKIKTLDALGRGVPVVATAFGAEGVSSTSQPGLEIVADSVAAAEALARLVDPAEHQRAVVGAQQLFSSKFSPEAIHKAYDQVFLPSRQAGSDGR